MQTVSETNCRLSGLSAHTRRYGQALGLAIVFMILETIVLTSGWPLGEARSSHFDPLTGQVWYLQTSVTTVTYDVFSMSVLDSEDPEFFQRNTPGLARQIPDERLRIHPYYCANHAGKEWRHYGSTWFGLPMPWCGYYWFQGQIPPVTNYDGALDLGRPWRSRVVLPLTLRVWPCLVALVCHSAVCYVVMSVGSQVIAIRRRRKGLCVYCGYPLLNASEIRCSECGHLVFPR